jgi:predicted DNA-binding transcriptional regulator AlpA
MPKQTALPSNLPPRLICRAAAAAYACVSPGTFDKMVDDGEMPRPKRLRDRRKAWDVRELDEAIDQLPTDAASSDDDTWGDV